MSTQFHILAVQGSASHLNELAPSIDELDADIVLVPSMSELSDSMAALNPDLVLIDTELTNFDDCEIFKSVTTKKKTRDTPIIALSDNDSIEEIARLYDAGVYDYFGSNCSNEILTAKIKAAVVCPQLTGK